MLLGYFLACWMVQILTNNCSPIGVCINLCVVVLLAYDGYSYTKTGCLQGQFFGCTDYSKMTEAGCK